MRQCVTVDTCLGRRKGLVYVYIQQSCVVGVSGGGTTVLVDVSWSLCFYTNMPLHTPTTTVQAIECSTVISPQDFWLLQP